MLPIKRSRSGSLASRFGRKRYALALSGTSPVGITVIA
jgi:hypothetical protein